MPGEPTGENEGPSDEGPSDEGPSVHQERPSWLSPLAPGERYYSQSYLERTRKQESSAERKEPIVRNLPRNLGKWTAVVVASLVALIIGVAIGMAAGGEDSSSTAASATDPETVTVTGPTSTETMTETVSATKAEREELKQRAQVIAARAAEVKAREREVREDARALQRRIGVVERSKFGDGIFIVGKEVKPGTYRSRGGGSCYWARLSGFGGSDIIVNGGFNRNQIVTISSSDRGFESRSCGTWYRVG